MDQAYQDLEAELHDSFWASEGPAAELPVLIDWLRREPGTALEMGSGSGRLLLPLLQQGFHIEGLEPSERMLELCRREAASRKLSPLLHLGSMEHNSLTVAFDHVLIPAFTFQLAEDDTRALAQVRARLHPQGWLYVTTFIPMAELDGDLPENTWYEDHSLVLNVHERATLHTRHRLDRAARLLWRDHHYRVIHDQRGVIHEHRSVQRIRWFDNHAWLKQLAACGFHRIRQFADFSPSRPVRRNSQIITTLAQRCD